MALDVDFRDSELLVCWSQLLECWSQLLECWFQLLECWSQLLVWWSQLLVCWQTVQDFPGLGPRGPIILEADFGTSFPGLSTFGVLVSTFGECWSQHLVSVGLNFGVVVSTFGVLADGAGFPGAGAVGPHHSGS